MSKTNDFIYKEFNTIIKDLEKEKTMYADNEFLIGLSNQLLEIADETTDPNTENKLRDLAEMTIKTCV